jgi:hypothetical protein
MRVKIVLEVTDDQRRRISAFSGLKHLATREDIRQEAEALWISHMDDLDNSDKEQEWEEAKREEAGDGEPS